MGPRELSWVCGFLNMCALQAASGSSLRKVSTVGLELGVAVWGSRVFTYYSLAVCCLGSCWFCLWEEGSRHEIGTGGALEHDFRRLSMVCASISHEVRSFNLVHYLPVSPNVLGL